MLLVGHSLQLGICMSKCMGSEMPVWFKRSLSAAGDAVVWVTVPGLHVHLLWGVL